MKKGVYLKNLVLAGTALLAVNMAGTAMAVSIQNLQAPAGPSDVVTIHGINQVTGGTLINPVDTILFGAGALTDAEFRAGAWGLTSVDTAIGVTLKTPPNQTVTTPAPKPGQQAVGVPDGGATVAMLGGTFWGLVCWKRKLRA